MPRTPLLALADIPLEPRHVSVGVTKAIVG